MKKQIQQMTKEQLDAIFQGAQDPSVIKNQTYQFGFNLQLNFTAANPAAQIVTTNTIPLPNKRMLLKKVYSVIDYDAGGGGGSPLVGESHEVKISQANQPIVGPPSLPLTPIGAGNLFQSIPANTAPLAAFGLGTIALWFPANPSANNIQDVPDGSIFGSNGLQIQWHLPIDMNLGDSLSYFFAASFYILP